MNSKAYSQDTYYFGWVQRVNFKFSQKWGMDVVNGGTLINDSMLVYVQLLFDLKIGSSFVCSDYGLPLA